mmetsp:Transcript_82425/g.233204  ORF Transcript_82425/g.233204 Transcript_82425/m.233204 type:complete len:201 (-) Transcript_82425:97-699(-)
MPASPSLPPGTIRAPLSPLRPRPKLGEMAATVPRRSCPVFRILPLVKLRWSLLKLGGKVPLRSPPKLVVRFAFGICEFWGVWARPLETLGDLGMVSISPVVFMLKFVSPPPPPLPPPPPPLPLPPLLLPPLSCKPAEVLIPNFDSSDDSATLPNPLTEWWRPRLAPLTPGIFLPGSMPGLLPGLLPGLRFLPTGVLGLRE